MPHSPSISAQPTANKFALRKLIYDSQYRGFTIQIIATIALLLLILWLGNNVVANLAALGKDFNFSYLGTEAGYDINQKLIAYNNDMSHGRAALVGIANTLLVTFLGCAVATILGIFAGVLRLSDNFIVNRLMAVYVEAFRNVPMLLWIVLVFAVLSESLPQPRDFRGAEPTAHMHLFDSIAITGRGTYLPRIGFTNSISGHPAISPREGVPAVASGIEDWLLILGVIAASLIAMRFMKRRANHKQVTTGHRPTIWPVQLGLFFIPLILVLSYLGVSIISPFLKGFNFTEGTFLRNSLLAMWFALALYRGAFIAEIVRSGILAIQKGQSEAATALGLSRCQTMRLVVLPQARRIIIPPLISQYLGLLRDSSLGLAVGYMDVRATLGGISINQTGRELEGILLLGLFYLAISLLISFVINMYNKSVQLKER